MKRIVVTLIVFIASLQLSNADMWVRKADFGGVGRKGTCGFSINNKGYVGMGANYTTLFSDFWEYDPTTNVWTQKSDFPGHVNTYQICFSINGLGYCGIGIDSLSFWEYNPSSNVWARKANFPGIGRICPVGFSIGNKGYAGTGSDPWYQTTYNDFWEYDPTTDIWTQLANTPGNPRESAIAFSIGNKGYIGSGSYQYFDSINMVVISDPLYDFWEYDQGANSWIQKADFPGVQRGAAVDFAIGSKGYYGTGFENVFCPDFWEYDTLMNSWAQKTSFPYGISYGIGFTIDSIGYVYTGDTTLNQFYQYDPNGWVGINEVSKINNDICVYPNPASSTLTIRQTVIPTKEESLFIFDVYGREIYYQPINNAQSTIDISNWSNGVYIYQLTGAKETVRGKFVKE